MRLGTLRAPPLEVGDSVRLEVEGLGVLEGTVA
jgi:2-keto-4-pentenoate hydratase/2-oxohepta-3-ene-1,7-dioic acid hydratase in catechol pathway